jgi:hypothetical protein
VSLHAARVGFSSSRWLTHSSIDAKASLMRRADAAVSGAFGVFGLSDMSRLAEKTGAGALSSTF